MPSLAFFVLCPLVALGLMAAPPAKGRQGFPDGTLEAVYENPDPLTWFPMDLGMAPNSDRLNVTLRHKGIQDARGVNVQPVMAITAWRLPAPDGMSLDDFSAYLLRQMPMKDPRRETRDGRLFVTGTADYGGYTHILRRAFVVRGRIGLDLLCDSTDTVFEKVREDFEKWVATVALEPRIVPVPVQLPEPPKGKENGVVTVYTHLLEKQKPGGKLEGDVAAMYVNGGMAIYWNRSKPYFKILVEGRTFEGFTGSSHLAFKADGAFLQLVCADADEFCPDHASQSPERVLLAHRDWEFRYLEETTGVPCQLRSWAGTLADGTPILYWDLTPEKTPTRGLPRHVFCTRYKDGVVMGLNSVEGSETSLARAMDLVYSATATIRFSDLAYDLAKLQEQERN
ncbi:hypothetical protein [Mesoterricola silvestris]|uniref:DUF1795 domain-containing protein n=1 Tax=Mesoterricola silvestris TaxID=2927979 RepID=A0AA48GRG7_9BACT|nr:hypothetical protein [Mesoterricola silvestris]BDU74350.1 hypothetical protein METEAL_35240 [Mesoterricola silvestris]